MSKHRSLKRSRKRHLSCSSTQDDRASNKQKGTTGITFDEDALRALPVSHRRSIRLMLKDLVGTHSTEIMMRLREGLLSPNLRLALKYLQFGASYVDGKPVETHRMVGLQDGPSGTYDLTKLTPKAQKDLLKLLRAAKDTTEPKGEA